VRQFLLHLTILGRIALLVVGTDALAEAEGPPAFVADIQVHTPAEVRTVLERLDALANAGTGFPDHDPVVLVLHGDEALAFTRDRYDEFMDIVDRAARLEAFGLLDVRICEQWMSDRGISRAELPAFVDSVPDGRATVRLLERQGYVRF
jgi:intracellular sulfur oxidation DsrE/DsrF family protein